MYANVRAAMPKDTSASGETNSCCWLMNLKKKNNNGLFSSSPVYPYLKLFGRKYGFEFASSEMRWGIREE